MSDLEKAYKLASEWVDSMGGLDNISYIFGDDVSGLVQAFHDAGLLMPDLPGPDSHDERGWPIYGETEYTTHFNMYPFKRIPYINCPLGEWLSADMARKEAYRLLAAAEWLDSWDKEHAEKEQDNEQFRES